MLHASPDAPRFVDARGGRVVLRDRKTGDGRDIDVLAGHAVKDLSPEGRYLVCTSPWFQSKNANRTELVVWDSVEGAAILRDGSRLIHTALIDGSARYVLVHSDHKNLRCIAIATGAVVSEGEAAAPLYASGLDRSRQRVWFGPAKKKGVAATFDFGEGAFGEAKLPTRAQVARVAWAGDGLVFSDRDNVLRRCALGDRRSEWEVDCAARHGASLGRIWSGGLFVSADQALVIVEGGFDDAHPFGLDFVFDARSGELLRTLVREQGRGYVSGVWSADTVVTFGGNLVNLRSGDVSRPRRASVRLTLSGLGQYPSSPTREGG